MECCVVEPLSKSIVQKYTKQIHHPIADINQDAEHISNVNTYLYT